MEIDCATPGWKFHPCERLANEDFHSPYLIWNRDRNTLVLMSWAKYVPEFDLNGRQWLEERATSAGEALLFGAGLRTARDIPGADYAEETGNEFEVKSDTAKGIWNVSAVDPQTRRAKRFVLAFDFKGAPLAPMEKEAVHPTGAVGCAVVGGCGRSGLWFKLGTESRYSGPFKLFWLPWAEVHRGEAPIGLLDLVFVKDRKFFATESDTPANLSLQLNSCYEILERNVRASTVLVKCIYPTAFLWARREANGTFTWRVPPVQQSEWSAPGLLSSFAVLSPDGLGVRSIASNKQEIREWRAQDCQEKTIFTAPEGEKLRSFAYTGDDMMLAWAGKQTVCLQTSSGSLSAFQFRVGEVFPMAWSPNNKRLLVSNAGTVKLLERTEQGFNEVRQWKGERYSWTPDGTRVVLGVRHNVSWPFMPYALQLIDLSDGNIKPLVPQFFCEMYTLSADGQSVWAAGCFQVDQQKKCILKISLADGSFTEVLGNGDISQVSDLLPMK